VIDSFRNRLFAGYKTDDGVDPALLAQFPLAEEVTRALGITVWPMVEFEADDAIAAAAARFAKQKSVTQIRLCSPDKDLAQCVSGNRVVLWDRKNQTALDEKGVAAKFGVPPELIPDLLALVGDTADGIPGIDRWGMKSAAAVLAAHGPLEKIPASAGDWKAKVRGAEVLAANLEKERAAATLYKKLATLRLDVPLEETLEQLEWKGEDAAAWKKVAAELNL
jgi:5'-3' exonuclease